MGKRQDASSGCPARAMISGQSVGGRHRVRKRVTTGHENERRVWLKEGDSESHTKAGNACAMGTLDVILGKTTASPRGATLGLRGSNSSIITRPCGLEERPTGTDPAPSLISCWCVGLFQVTQTLWASVHPRSSLHSSELSGLLGDRAAEEGMEVLEVCPASLLLGTPTLPEIAKWTVMHMTTFSATWFIQSNNESPLW